VRAALVGSSGGGCRVNVPSIDSLTEPCDVQIMTTSTTTTPVVDLTMSERDIENEVSRRLQVARSRLNGRLITPHQPDGTYQP
jgi:hypothetical protein